MKADKGKTYLRETIASLKKALKRIESGKTATKAISESIGKFKTGRYEP